MESPNPKPTMQSRYGSNGRRVGLKPEKGWAKRNYNYVSGSLLPALVRRREKTGPDSPPDFGGIKPHQIEIAWIGHATFLVRTSEFNALIDPVWAKWVGPIKRNRDPGIDIEHLPPIDLVMITHAHFDHLCRKSLKKILDGTQTILVPDGVSKFVRKLDVSHVVEMKDWDRFVFRDAEIDFTPAHHWGARFIHDTHRGFGGFVIKTIEHTLYHAGDSAYFDGFADIGKRYDIDTALLPIGAYDCPSGREVHMNPEEALRAFSDLGANRMIPMHHATFPISNEKLCEPLRRLHAEADERDLGEKVIAPEEGELILLSSRDD